jgi:hypothetical protein
MAEKQVGDAIIANVSMLDLKLTKRASAGALQRHAPSREVYFAE